MMPADGGGLAQVGRRIVRRERKEMRRRMWMDKNIKIKVLFSIYICMTNEDVWTQVAEFNKFRLQNFGFQIYETKWNLLMFTRSLVVLIRVVDVHERGERPLMAPTIKSL
jgi:hypothetical protein